MDPQDREKLRQHRIAIVKDLNVEMIMDRLLQDGILSSEDRERILGERTTQDRCRFLLDMLPTKGPKSFGSFKMALRDNHGWLADLL